MRFVAVLLNLMFLAYGFFWLLDGSLDIDYEEHWPVVILTWLCPLASIIAILLIKGLPWLSIFRKEKEGDRDFKASTILVSVERILERSTNARISAWVSITLMCLLSLYTIFIFAQAGQMRYDDSGRPMVERWFSDGRNQELLKENEDLKRELEKQKMIRDAAQIEADLKTEEVKLRRAELESRENQSSRVINLITNSITRIGAVFVALYLIQIMLSVMRYSFRVADHSAVAAEALQIASGDPGKTREILETLNSVQIDFGKVPVPPSSDLKELLASYLTEITSVVRSGRRTGSIKSGKAAASAAKTDKDESGAA